MCEKTIAAIVEPSVERNTVEITPTDWAELKTLVADECTLYRVTKGTYNFDISNPKIYKISNYPYVAYKPTSL